MEKNYWEKSKSFAKAAALSGAMALSPEAVSQTNGDWGVVSENEITRRNISESDIQTIDLRKNEEYEVDNSKLAIRFIDKGGNQAHYWINNNPIKNELIIETLNSSGDMLTSDTVRWNNSSEVEDETHEESDHQTEEMSTLSEEDIDYIFENIDIKNKVEEFFSNFEMESVYVIDPRNKKHYHPSVNYFTYINPPKDLEKLYGSIIIKDHKKAKQILIEANSSDDFYRLIGQLFTWGEKKGLREYLYVSNEIGKKNTRDEKIEYLKNLLSSHINNLFESLPSYEPPVIMEPEKRQSTGTSGNSDIEKTKKETEDKNISLGEDDIKKAIDEVF